MVEITGGEPLVRKGVTELCRSLREIDGIESLTLTTNGVWLAEKAKAIGLDPAKEKKVLAAWMANIILFPAGMFFMKQAKNDARLFETDFYNVIFLKIRAYVFSLKSKFRKTNSLN